MYLKKGINILAFLKKVNDCSGDVFFDYGEGDSMALKSAMCQFIFSTLKDRPDILYSGEVRFDLRSDATFLRDFLITEFRS